MNKKLLFCTAAWLVAAQPALALNDTIGVTIGAGKTANLISFGNSSVISETGICDATTINQCAAVSVGGALSIAGAVTNGGTFAVQLTGATNNINNIAGTVSVSGASAQFVNGWSVPLGSTTDSPCTLPASGTGCSQIAIEKAIANAANGAIPAGTNLIGKVGIDQTTPGTTNGVSLQATATGGCTPTHYLSAASTNSTNVKNAAGTLCSVTIINNTATAANFRVYNTSSAPTCSSGTGVVANYGIQANTTSPGISPNLGPFGMALGTGISFCLTAYDGTDTNNSNSVTGIQINLAYN
jgi:hypothetical protein